jgi:putative methionine-R-sulfoxide reductase with GAF domain
MLGEKLAGVLDIDSPVPDRFAESDQHGIELLCRTFTGELSGKTAQPRGTQFI